MKFSNEKITEKGEKRAFVSLKTLKTVWFNTGTQCNLSCDNCYIESSPTNDRLVYLTLNDLVPFLEEIKINYHETNLIGFTGGEPFLNPSIISLLESSLETGLDVLVLTNAFRVIKRHKNELIRLKNIYHDKLHLRISLDHFSKEIHEKERGEGTFYKTLDSIKELVDENFNISIAGRSLSDDPDPIRGYQLLFDKMNINLKLKNLDNIVIFPEMSSKKEVPEITISCWDILNKSPDDQMCATERMIVKRKGENKPVVLPCTLLAYDKNFELGETLKSSRKDVYLNHKFCAEFCVLGGASCSSAK